MDATDITADRMPMTMRPFSPTGKRSRTKVARMLALDAGSGYSTAAARPSQATATAIGSIRMGARSAPRRAAAASRAAKLREKLSIATKKLSTIETTSAATLSQPCAPKS